MALSAFRDLQQAAHAEDAKCLTKEHLADVEWLPADVTLIEKIGEALYETKDSKEHGAI